MPKLSFDNPRPKYPEVVCSRANIVKGAHKKRCQIKAICYWILNKTSAKGVKIPPNMRQTTSNRHVDSSQLSYYTMYIYIYIYI